MNTAAADISMSPVGTTRQLLQRDIMAAIEEKADSTQTSKIRRD
jgi:hypothetical protein